MDSKAPRKVLDGNNNRGLNSTGYSVTRTSCSLLTGVWGFPSSSCWKLQPPVVLQSPTVRRCVEILIVVHRWVLDPLTTSRPRPFPGRQGYLEVQCPDPRSPGTKIRVEREIQQNTGVHSLYRRDRSRRSANFTVSTRFNGGSRKSFRSPMSVLRVSDSITREFVPKDQRNGDHLRKFPPRLSESRSRHRCDGPRRT